jgi:DNA ligase 1
MDRRFAPLLARRAMLAWLAGAVSCVAASPSSRAPALMLARDAPDHVDPGPYLVSEKLDGVRAFWDGGSLRFRSGLPVAAPPWFMAGLPPVALDGELWLGRGQFDALSGTVRKARPVDAEWRAVRYEVFDLPSAPEPFVGRVERLNALARTTPSPVLSIVPQLRLADAAALRRHLLAVVRAGGEGLMLHRADAYWAPGRGDALLKLKPMQDAEAMVVGHVAGRGRHAGRLGALRVRTGAGVEFSLGTGFSDVQREDPPAPGTRVTYTFRGVTLAGVPRFASFLRVCDGV